MPHSSPSRPRPLLWFSLYALSIAAVFAGLGTLFVQNRETVEKIILTFFFPESWMAASRVFLNWVIDRNPELLANLLVSGMLIVIPMITFPLKEKASAEYELYLHRDDPNWHPPKEPPLWIQALDETLLFLFYAAFAMTALRVGLTEGYETLGTGLSHLVLALSLAIDFMGPTLARHCYKPSSQVAFLYLKKPLQSFVFGCIFAVPPMICEKLLSHASATAIYLSLAAVNLAMILGATAFGTFVTTKWIPCQAPERNRLQQIKHLFTAGTLWLGTIALCIYQIFFFGPIARTAWEASPLFKLQWTIDFSSVEPEWPSLLSPQIGVSFAFDIHNPTDRNARIGQNQLLLSHNGDPIATSLLPQFEVPPRQTSRQRIAFRLKLESGLLDKGVALVKEITSEGFWNTAKSAGKSAITGSSYAITLILTDPHFQLRLPILGELPKRRPAP